MPAVSKSSRALATVPWPPLVASCRCLALTLLPTVELLCSRRPLRVAPAPPQMFGPSVPAHMGRVDLFIALVGGKNFTLSVAGGVARAAPPPGCPACWPLPIHPWVRFTRGRTAGLRPAPPAAAAADAAPPPALRLHRAAQDACWPELRLRAGCCVGRPPVAGPPQLQVTNVGEGDRHSARGWVETQSHTASFILSSGQIYTVRGCSLAGDRASNFYCLPTRVQSFGPGG